MMASIARRKNRPVDAYSMRVVQRLTGLSPDTIRVWDGLYYDNV